MKKLACRGYLNQPNPLGKQSFPESRMSKAHSQITRQKLWIYAEHLAKAHGKRLPKEIKLVHLTCSELSEQKAYEEVEFLAHHVEASYGGEQI